MPRTRSSKKVKNKPNSSKFTSSQSDFEIKLSGRRKIAGVINVDQFHAVGIKKGNLKRLPANTYDWKLSSYCVVQVERLNYYDTGNNTEKSVKVEVSETTPYFDEIIPKKEPEDVVDNFVGLSIPLQYGTCEIKKDLEESDEYIRDGRNSRDQLPSISANDREMHLYSKCSVKMKKLRNPSPGETKNNELMTNVKDVDVQNGNNLGQKRKILTDLPSVQKKTERFRCVQCDMFFSEENFVSHYQRMHPGKMPFKCSVCSYDTLRRSEFLLHFELHKDNRPMKPNIIRDKTLFKMKQESFRCTDCDLFFDENDFILHRREKHHDETPFKCSICEFKSHQRKAFVEHFFNSHNKQRTYSGKKHKNSSIKPECSVHGDAVSLNESTIIPRSHKIDSEASSKDVTDNIFVDAEPPSLVEPVDVLSDDDLCITMSLNVSPKNQANSNRINVMANKNDDFIFKCHFCHVRFASSLALDNHIRLHEYHKEKREKRKSVKKGTSTVRCASISTNSEIKVNVDDEPPQFKITDNDISKSVELIVEPEPKIINNVDFTENVDEGDQLYLGEPQAVDYLNDTSETQDNQAPTDQLCGDPQLTISATHFESAKGNPTSEELYGALQVLKNETFTEICNVENDGSMEINSDNFTSAVNVDECRIPTDYCTADGNMKGFACNDCGLHFERRFHKAFLQHRLSDHNDHFPFICDHCPMKFDHLTALVRHKFSIHTGKIQCLYCDKEFTIIHHAILHQANFHPEEVKRESPKFSLKRVIAQYTDCEMKVVNSSQSMTRSAGESFQCKICAKSFTTARALVQHKRRCEGVSCICKACSQAFHSPYARDQHFKDSPPCMKFVRDIIAMNKFQQSEQKKNSTEMGIVIANVQSLSDPNTFVTYTRAGFCETSLASTSSHSNSELEQATFESDSLSTDLNFDVLPFMNSFQVPKDSQIVFTSALPIEEEKIVPD